MKAFRWSLFFVVLQSWLLGAGGGSLKDMASNEYDTILYGKEKNSAVGFSVASGDVNGDGISDIIIGAPYLDARVPKVIDDAGATFLYFGRKEIGKSVYLLQEADVVIYGASANDDSGFAVACGDVNGDGIKDILIGAPLADNKSAGKQSDAGITYVVLGRKQFTAKTMSLQTDSDAQLCALRQSECSGSALATGDFNGDGITDVLIGAPMADAPANDSGAVYLYYGRTGVTGRHDLSKEAGVVVKGLANGDRIGMAVAAGDLNGDRISDLIIGGLEKDHANKTMRNIGAVWVILGGREIPKNPSLNDAAFTFTGSSQDDYVGSSMASGDLNSDLIDDLIVGVPYADVVTKPVSDAKAKREEDAGQVFVFYGRKEFAGRKGIRDGADLVILGAQGGSNYGDYAGGAMTTADINADGIADLALSAPLADATHRQKPGTGLWKDVGAVYIMQGRKDLPATLKIPSEMEAALYGAFPDDMFGGVALTKDRAKDGMMSGLFGLAGTLANPDSYRKAWMTPYYDRIYTKALAAGDVNGDGVSDLIVGAPAADGPKGAQQKIDDAGVVYVFYGSKPEVSAPQTQETAPRQEEGK